MKSNMMSIEVLLIEGNLAVLQIYFNGDLKHIENKTSMLFFIFNINTLTIDKIFQTNFQDTQ
jgi:hypothetical protein